MSTDAIIQPDPVFTNTPNQVVVATADESQEPARFDYNVITDLFISYIENNQSVSIRIDTWIVFSPTMISFEVPVFVDPISVDVTASVQTGPGSASVVFGSSFEYVDPPIPCLAPCTRVCMADGTLKEIQHVVRGDLVAGDTARTSVMRVSRVLRNPYRSDQLHSTCVFETGSVIGNNEGEVRVTYNHPIVYNGVRREAHSFRGAHGVKYHENTNMASVLDPSGTGNHAVYDLQFDVEGQYAVEGGAVIQSRSPCYVYDPLPQALYFDQTKYRSARSWGTVDHPIPMHQ